MALEIDITDLDHPMKKPARDIMQDPEKDIGKDPLQEQTKRTTTDRDQEKEKGIENLIFTIHHESL